MVVVVLATEFCTVVTGAESDFPATVFFVTALTVAFVVDSVVATVLAMDEARPILFLDGVES